MSYRFQIEVEREADGRWIAEIPRLPGVMVYGKTKHDAVRSVRALALRVLADRIERTKTQPSKAFSVSLALSRGATGPVRKLEKSTARYYSALAWEPKPGGRAGSSHIQLTHPTKAGS